MKRFYHDSSNQWGKQLASVVLFLFLFCAFCSGISFVSEETTKRQAESLELAISRGIAHCYATEGHYPESLSYLKEHYGIHYDSERYFVDYQVLGENIFPDVTVLIK